MSNVHSEAAARLLIKSESTTYLTQQNTLVAMANMQATLALAYEQRTANLLALWAKPTVSMNDPHTGNDVTWGICEDRVGRLLQEILERLGVNE